MWAYLLSDIVTCLISSTASMQSWSLLIYVEIFDCIIDICIYFYNCIFTLSASLLVWFNATKNNANRVLYLVEEIVVGKDVKSVLQTWPVVMCKVISKTWRLGRIIKSHIDFNFTEIFYHIWVLYQEVIFAFSVFRTLLDMPW